LDRISHPAIRPKRGSRKQGDRVVKYECFHLVLMVTHACNLRCRYCYTGRKMARSMELRVGRAAIDRAIRSIRRGGILELGFFGGEPLLEADHVAVLADYAREVTGRAGIALRTGLTTNGTVRTGMAWDVMLRDDLDLCVSHDGLPDVHDRHRRRPDGRGQALEVVETIERLLTAGRVVRAVMVVRPDTAVSLPDGIQWLRDRGVRRIDLTLDVWASWAPDDMAPMENALVAAAELWAAGLPEAAINWFDEKAALLAGLRLAPSARCGFGDGEIAVAPSGRLYPCERLIGEDAEDHPMRLPGHATEGDDFCRLPAPGRSAPGCSACAIQAQCNTTCRCNNYVRTGDPTRPDALLCLVERVSARETARVLGRCARLVPMSS
jgi:uncharacterized protein